MKLASVVRSKAEVSSTRLRLEEHGIRGALWLMALALLGPSEALGSLTRALELDPGRRSARTNLASALAALGHYDEAVSQAERVLGEDPRRPEAHAILAHALAARGELARAVSEYQRSIALDPGNPRWAENLAILLRGPVQR